MRDGDSVLFDRVSDPEQVHNLYDDPGHRGVVDQLSERVRAHHAAVDSPALEWLSSCGR